MQGLSALEEVGGELDVRRNSALQNLTGLESLTKVGAILIYGNDTLTMVTSLSGITSTPSALKISNNPSLPECNALALADVLQVDAMMPDGSEPKIDIEDNLHPCQFLPSDCKQQGLGCAMDCSAEADYLCAETTHDGDLTVQGTAYVNFEAYTTSHINGTLSVWGDVSDPLFSILKSVQGLRIHSINENVLPQFPLLQEIRGNLYIYSNSNITSLDVFPALESVKGTISISYNTSLPWCNLDNWIQTLGSENVGKVEIDWQPTPCDDVSECDDAALSCVPDCTLKKEYRCE